MMGGVHFNGFSIIFQLLNIGLLIGFIVAIGYGFHFLIVKLPRILRERNEILGRIEKSLDDINKKINGGL